MTVAYRILRYLGRRSILLAELARRAYPPASVIAALAAIWLAVPAATSNGWHEPFFRGILLAVIASVGWLIAALTDVAADTALRTFRMDVRDNLSARRVHTQITVIRRVAVAVIAVLTIGAMLVTFPQARAVGASVLASAGLAGIVAALAAQSMLGNVLAGLQLAFGNALRLDDVVVVEGEWGRVEEMTLGYVVVRIWDERRLILPSSYFTSTPFQNWTRTGASVLGTVEIDLDWSLPVEEMRREMRRILEGEADRLWDGRVCVLQVTDATGGMIRVRPLVSAANSSALWDLRCLVREKLVAWVQQQQPSARPRVRADLEPAGAGSAQLPPTDGESFVDGAGRAARTAREDGVEVADGAGASAGAESANSRPAPAQRTD
ncbi:mechanosensitive ion channel domain-containing protein [Plantactinospora sp. B6F1]|uniref:mechanosensitive ion channel domain-containing protein n=1 Tax=Plantactinospora sp. B6F1 TaxID=3158971 RepID=UPI00102C3C0C